MSDKNTDKTQNEKLNAGEEISEFAKTAFIAIFLAVLIRTFLYEPFNIPSGSMKPTLLVGDYLFVSKPAYGYSRHSFPFSFAPLSGRILEKMPERGDVIVFKLPTDTRVDYIKRVVGLPGETVQVKSGRLYINGTLVDRRLVGTERISDAFRGAIVMKEYIETLPGGVEHLIYEEGDDYPLDNTDPVLIPEGHVFVMGDNRDNSQDSRVDELVGPVPFENFVGKADFIFFSTNGFASIFEFWKWPWTIRYDRFFKGLKPSSSASGESNA